jgi:tRNA-intron endonuclease
LSSKVPVEFLENFLVVWNAAEGSRLYGTGFYGKPLGIPKPKIPKFDAPLILDLMEGFYLAEKGIVTVYETPKKRKVNINRLRQKVRRLYDEFEEKYAVYKDLREDGLIVSPGIKFGCDFAVYKQGPGFEHAPYMVSVKKTGSEITATEIVKAGRLATTVRKRFIIAVPDLTTGGVEYLIFRWFKA